MCSDNRIICTDFATSDCCIICIKLQFTSCINATTTLLVIASCNNTQILANYFALAHSDACSLNQTCASACVNSCARNVHSSTCNHICCIHGATCQSHSIIGFNSISINSSVINKQLRSGNINLLRIDGAVINGHIASCIRYNIACTSTDAAIFHGYASTSVHIYIASSCFDFATIYKHIICSCDQGHIRTTHACALSHVDICFLVGNSDITISFQILVYLDNIVCSIGHIGDDQIITNHAHSLHIQIPSFIVATNDGCIAMLRIYIYILQLIQLARQSQVGASLCHSVGCYEAAISLGNSLASSQVSVYCSNATISLGNSLLSSQVSVGCGDSTTTLLNICTRGHVCSSCKDATSTLDNIFFCTQICSSRIDSATGLSNIFPSIYINSHCLDSARVNQNISNR